jgi:hypothetical protein
MRKIFLISLISALILTAGAFAWVLDSASALPSAASSLTSDAEVTVALEPWLVFSPAKESPTTGLIFYPGGKVDPQAYAPSLRRIAEQGFLAVIVPMPLNLAVLAPDRAGSVMAAFPEVQHWAVGGHSLGGAMAADFAGKQPQLVQGLVLWAAYPAGSTDLSTSDLSVVAIFGTRDGLVSEEDLEIARQLLPPATRWVAVEGGNHAQFGLYGPQAGDNPAELEWQAQQDQVVGATLELLHSLNRGQE